MKLPLYRELKHCRAENIFFEELGASPAYRLNNEFLLAVNRSENEQVLDILHELVHGLPKYRAVDFERSPNEVTEPLEDDIQEQAEEIYKKRPFIREHIRKQLQLAKRQNPWYQFAEN